jgi:Fe-S cluster biogenesis protein NfuA
MTRARNHSLHDAVETELDGLRPALIADGGNVELLDVDDEGTVRLVLQGECATCPAQFATLRVGLEEPLRSAVPGVTAVVLV